MERTILFRGIIKYPDDIFKGFWYGNLIIYANGDTFIRQIETGQEFEVIPETVGQFTGLTDKNGVMIFEGDMCFNSNKTLLTCPEDKRLYLVKWQEGKYIETGGPTWLGKNPSFIFEKINNDKNYMSLIFNQSQIEVIGNIHDKHVL